MIKECLFSFVPSQDHHPKPTPAHSKTEMLIKTDLACALLDPTSRAWVVHGSDGADPFLSEEALLGVIKAIAATEPAKNRTRHLSLALASSAEWTTAVLRAIGESFPKIEALDVRCLPEGPDGGEVDLALEPSHRDADAWGAAWRAMPTTLRRVRLAFMAGASSSDRAFDVLAWREGVVDFAYQTYGGASKLRAAGWSAEGALAGLEALALPRWPGAGLPGGLGSRLRRLHVEEPTVEMLGALARARSSRSTAGLEELVVPCSGLLNCLTEHPEDRRPPAPAGLRRLRLFGETDAGHLADLASSNILWPWLPEGCEVEVGAGGELERDVLRVEAEADAARLRGELRAGTLKLRQGSLVHVAGPRQAMDTAAAVSLLGELGRVCVRMEQAGTRVWKAAGLAGLTALRPTPQQLADLAGRMERGAAPAERLTLVIEVDALVLKNAAAAFTGVVSRISAALRAGTELRVGLQLLGPGVVADASAAARLGSVRRSLIEAMRGSAPAPEMVGLLG